MKNIENNNELTEQYKAAVRTKHGLTAGQVSEIVAEGVTEQWPLE